MIRFFWNLRLFFIGKSTLAAHYFPIISTFVLDVSVGGWGQRAELLQCGLTSRWQQQPDEPPEEAWSCTVEFALIFYSELIPSSCFVKWCFCISLEMWCFVLVRIKTCDFWMCCGFTAAHEHNILKSSISLKDSVWWQKVSFSHINVLIS